MVTPEQPKGKPESGDWTTSVRQETQLFRDNAAVLGLDANRLVRGFILSTIIFDDLNIFTGLLKRPRFSPKLGRQAAKGLIDRLEWEVGTPELPENIRERLSQTRELVGPLDMGTRRGFHIAYSVWERARAFVEEELNSSEELQNDAKYYADEGSKFDDLRNKATLNE